MLKKLKNNDNNQIPKDDIENIKINAISQSTI